MPFIASPEKAEQLFRYLFEEASLGIAVEDLNGTLLLANPALCSMLGFSNEEMVGMNCSQFTDPEDEQDDWALFQKLRNGLIDRYTLEKRYVRKDGSRIWGRLNVSLLKDNAESPLVFALVEEITHRKMAEQTQREKEELLRLALRSGKMYAYQWDVSTDTVVRTSESVNILDLGDSPTSLTRQQLMDRVHPDDRSKWVASVAELTTENPDTHLVYRVLLPNGGVVWLEKNARAYFDEKGKMVRMIGMVADVTGRKESEEALAGISRRLIEAQEQERSRIARDLHDDIAQRITLLGIELGQLQNSPSLAGEPRVLLDRLREQASEISFDVQAMSHALHSSKLEYLGMVVAMRGFCREFSAQHRVQIDFTSQELPTPLPLEISLSLFRVLQEAVQNAAKHSMVAHYKVQIWAESGDIHLMVSDLGIGFDAETAKLKRGLGLTSMQERIRLVDGELSIDTQPTQGTTVHARVPLRLENRSKGASA